MKKINKMNINGEVYDIQDNSSGYITGEEVDKFLPKGYVITTQVNTKENQETASKIWEDIKNGKPVEVWYQWATSEYRRMIGYRFFETSYQLDMYFERDSFTTTYPKDEVDLTATYAVEITYHHSDNIYNRVLILANRQAFLIKNSSVNIATRNYVDTKFAEALAMGFKVEVVEALPIENISHQVIYLVLNGDDEENNIYDEFVYNSNDEWEKIGSTKTDLSNYYNKDEVDEKIEEHDLGYFHVFVPEITDGSQNKESETYTILKDFFTNVYDSSKNIHITDGKKHFYFTEISNNSSFFIFSYTGSGIMTANTSNGNSQKTFSDYYLLYVYKTNNEITGIEFRNQSEHYPVRPVTTEVNHNITHKYNLANKSYADMASEYDCEYYGIRTWATSQVYEVGEIIYNPSNEKLYKVIKRMSYRPSISSAYAEELTEEEIETLKRPKKEVVQAEFDDLVKGITSDGIEYIVDTEETPINYEVTNLSDNYGFELSEDGYYQNNNQGVSNSWAMCKVIFNNDFDIELTIDYIGDGYSAFNYAVLGQLDVELGKSTNYEGDNNSSKVKRTSRDDNSSDVRQVKYLIPAGEHFICMKYVKTHTTIGTGTDTFKFKFNTTVSQEITDTFYVADKQYVDEALNVYVIKDFNFDYSNTQYANDEENRKKFNQYMNICYKKGHLIPLVLTDGSKEYTFLPNSNYLYIDRNPVVLNSSPTTSVPITGSTNWYGLSNASLSIGGSYTDGIYDCTNISITVNDYNFVKIENTRSYALTHNYSPAHKRYVDEKSLYDWENNNVDFWVKSTLYPVDAIIYDQIVTFKYYKCITEHTSASSFNTAERANWQELTQEELEAIKRPSKQYVDETVANIDAVSIFKICENEAFNKTSSENTYDKFTLIGDFVEEFSVKINELLNDNKNGYVLFNGKVDYYSKAFVIYVNLEHIKKNKTMFFHSQVVDNRSKSLIGRLQISISYNYDDETNQISNVSSDSSNYIEWAKVMTNISKHEFTPTDDYHIANKVYVDTAISTALGDVNSILATLTTVEESEVSE